jgi:hypothetical protein
MDTVASDLTPHDLMPLDMAVATVFRRAYERRMQPRGNVRPTGDLDGLAYTLAELTPLYTYEADGHSIRELSKGDLAGALFRGGAKTLVYVDGRAPVTNLAINVKSLPAIIELLNATKSAELFAGGCPTGGTPGT